MEYNIEEMILDMADLVLEVRRLRKENLELLEYKERNEKRLNNMVSKNLKATADFIVTASKGGNEK